MSVVLLPVRLGARRRAQRLLAEARGLVAGHDLDGAEPVLERALESARASGSDHLAFVAGEELYQVLRRRRKHDESVPLLRDLLGRQIRRAGRAGEPTAAWRNELTRLLGQLGRYAEAEPLCRERLALARERRPAAPRAVGFALVTLAWCVRGQGRWGEAEGLCREALTTLESGAPGGADAWALAGLATVLLRRLELDQAEAALRRAVDSWASVGRAELAQVAEEQLLDLYVVAERHADALALSTTALGRSRRGAAAVADRERQLRNIERHAFLLQMAGRAEEAARYELRAEYLRQAIAAEPRRGDGASPDPTGPAFEGEPLPDFELPGIAVAVRAC
jgi:tetratricopeptide (TPR) repeat protein